VGVDLRLTVIDEVRGVRRIHITDRTTPPLPSPSPPELKGNDNQIKASTVLAKRGIQLVGLSLATAMALS
jgi:hypothetical protein